MQSSQIQGPSLLIARHEISSTHTPTVANIGIFGTVFSTLKLLYCGSPSRIQANDLWSQDGAAQTDLNI